MFKIEKLLPTSKWILEDNNSFLSIHCKEVKFPLDEKDTLLVNRMVNYIDACFFNQDEELGIRAGIAVAAPQVGCDKKIIYVHFIDINDVEHRYLLANPEIVATSVQKCYLAAGEGCLSVKKEHPGHIVRYNKIKVQALDMLNDNKPITIKAEGMLSICLQHEIDHLSGVLFYQHIDKKHPDLSDDETLICY